MKRKTMIKQLMGMGYSRNWANHFAMLFSAWGLPYEGFEEALYDPYEYQFQLIMNQYGHLFKNLPDISEIVDRYGEKVDIETSINYGFAPYGIDFHRVFFPTKRSLIK